MSLFLAYAKSRLFCCGSLLPVLSVRVSVTFHLMFVNIIFSSVSVLSGHLMKELITRLTICSLCILTIFFFLSFPILVLSAGFGF